MKFKIWLENNDINVKVDLSHFKLLIIKELKELHYFSVSRQSNLRNFKIDINLIKKGLKNFNKLPDLLNNLNNKKYIKDLIKEAEKWYLSLPILGSGEEKFSAMKATRHLSDYEDSFDVKEEDEPEPSHEEDAEEIISKTRENMEVLKKEIESIIQNTDWNGSSVTIKPNPGYEYGNTISFEPTESAEIIVGQKSALFTLFRINGKNEVGDIIEGGEEEEEFFSNNSEKNDYYTLIEELRRPGSTSVGKNLTLYTARPIEDREYFRKTKTLPINLFLTSSYDHASGLASDLSTSGGARDVYRVKINSKYLTQTLDGAINYYMVRKENAPVESINLI